MVHYSSSNVSQNQPSQNEPERCISLDRERILRRRDTVMTSSSTVREAPLWPRGPTRAPTTLATFSGKVAERPLDAVMYLPSGTDIDPSRKVIYASTGTEGRTVFEYVGNSLAQRGYVFCAGQLKGFGSSHKDLVDLSDKEILAHERASLLRLKHTLGRDPLDVHYVASSYGCTMAVRLAADTRLAQEGVIIKQLILIGPCFDHYHPLIRGMLKSSVVRLLENVLRPVGRVSLGDSWYAKRQARLVASAGEPEHSRVLENHYVYKKLPLAFLREFAGGILAAKGMMRNVRCPVTVIEGKRDFLVRPVPRADLSALRVQSEDHLVLSRSAHIICLDHDADTVVNAIAERVEGKGGASH